MIWLAGPDLGFAFIQKAWAMQAHAGKTHRRREAGVRLVRARGVVGIFRPLRRRRGHGPWMGSYACARAIKANLPDIIGRQHQESANQLIGTGHEMFAGGLFEVVSA